MSKVTLQENNGILVEEYKLSLKECFKLLFCRKAYKIGSVNINYNKVPELYSGKSFAITEDILQELGESGVSSDKGYVVPKLKGGTIVPVLSNEEMKKMGLL